MAVPRGQQPYQGHTHINSTKFVLEFKRVSMLLRHHMILRLRQWHELVTNTGQQRSVAVTAALVGVGVLILVLTFAFMSALKRAQRSDGHSARSDYPCLGQGRSFSARSQRGSVSKLTTAGLLTNKDLTPQQPHSTDVVSLSRMPTIGQGPEVTE